jgi:hypothetical protein
MNAQPAGTAPPLTPPPPPPAAARSRRWIWLTVAVVAIVVVAGTVAYYETRPSSSAGSPGSPPAPSPVIAGAFASGQVVTFTYNGSHTFSCTPSVSSLFPHDSNASAAAGTTDCAIGNASQSAVEQVPQWYLIPAFAGLSAFGLTNFNATSRGFPTLNGSAVFADCGAGATPTACLDQPPASFSPIFADVEAHAGLSGGVDGLPLGVLPYPAHDMVENYTSYPIVPWGTIIVYVLDPNIWPNRSTGACAALVPSNLSDPTANCLTSSAHIDLAETTCSSAAAKVAASADNPVSWALTHDAQASACAQVYVPAPGSYAPEGGSALLNSNLYEPYSVALGAPASFPS